MRYTMSPPTVATSMSSIEIWESPLRSSSQPRLAGLKASKSDCRTALLVRWLAGIELRLSAPFRRMSSRNRRAVCSLSPTSGSFATRAVRSTTTSSALNRPSQPSPSPESDLARSVMLPRIFVKSGRDCGAGSPPPRFVRSNRQVRFGAASSSGLVTSSALNTGSTSPTFAAVVVVNRAVEKLSR